MVRVGTKIYDPSYGVVYDNISDFENKAIDGYFKEGTTKIDGQDVNAWLIRKP